MISGVSAQTGIGIGHDDTSPGYSRRSDTKSGSASEALACLMHDGFYLLLMLKTGYAPNSTEIFSSQLIRFLNEFEKNARIRFNSPEDIAACKYAFCATVDETILSSNSAVRNAWEREPLQLKVFGEQLAGKNFFLRLEAVRRRGEAGLQVLDVFHMCLLIGFQGKYMLDGKERLNYLIDSLEKEILHLKGRRAPFAPDWQSPDNIRHPPDDKISIAPILGMLALTSLLAFTGFSLLLARHTNASLELYTQLIKPRPQTASISITLP